jgi:hypothetical protein
MHPHVDAIRGVHKDCIVDGGTAADPPPTHTHIATRTHALVVASSEVYTQIASLVTLRLLAQVSNPDNLEAPKYKCLVAMHDVQKVAATVQFELVKYVFEG